MRNILLSIATAGLCILPWTVSAEELQITTHADASSANPIYSYYVDWDTRTQLIYPATMLSSLPEGTVIDSLTYYFDYGNLSFGAATWAISLWEVAASEFTSTSFISTPQNATVYTGALAIEGRTMTIRFTTPYTYTGGNLLVDFDQLTAGTNDAIMFFNEYYGNHNYTLHGYRGNGGTGAWKNDLWPYLPQTTISYHIATSSCTKPEQVWVENSLPGSATILWSSTEATQYELTLTSSQNSLTTLTSDTFYQATNLLSDETYIAQVRAICAAGDTSYTQTTSFTSECLPVTALPWRIDFQQEPNSDPFAKACWENERVAGTPWPGYDHWEVREDYYTNVKHLVVFPNSPGVVTRLTTPAITIPAAGAYEVVVCMERPSYTGTLTPDEGLRISADGSEIGYIPHFYTYANPTYNIPAESAEGYYTYSFPIPNAGVQHIWLEAIHQDKRSFYINSLEVRAIPTCFPPTSIEQLSLTHQDITFGWNSVGSQTGWQVKYRPVGSSAYTSAMLLSPQLTIGGLQPDTDYSYEIIIHSELNGMLSGDSLVRTVNFHTYCAPLQISGMYTYGFEDWNPTNSFEQPGNPSCWNTIGGVRSHGYSHTGNRAVGLHNTWSSGDTATIATPLLNLPQGYQLLFYAKSATSNPAVLNIYWSQKQQMDSTAVLIGSTGNLPNNYVLYQFTLPVSGNGFLLFRNKTYNYEGYLDDITLEPAGGCNVPRMPSLSQPTLNSIVLSWIGDAPSYTVSYQSADGTVQASNVQVTDTFVVITGLQPSTLYKFSCIIVANCSATSQSAPMQASNLSIATLCSTISQLPWTEDFESTPSNELPTCWEIPAGVTSTWNYVNAAHYTGSQSYSLLSFADGWGEGQTVILPPVDETLSLQDLHLQLHYWSEEDEPFSFTFGRERIFGHLEVGVMSDPTNMSTYVRLATIPQNRSSRFPGTLFETDLSAAPQGYRYLAIRYAGGQDSYQAFINDITLSCPSGNCFAHLLMNVTTQCDTTMGHIIIPDSVYYGDTIQLTAVPNEHHTFVKWSNDSTCNPLEVVVLSDTSFTALFELASYSVLAHCDSTQGSIFSPTTAKYGETIHLTAMAYRGYRFSHWEDNTTDNPRTIIVSGPTEVTAFYESLENALDNIEGANTVCKILINGQVVIIRQGRAYNTLGQALEMK